MESSLDRKWDWLTAVLVFLLMQVSAARLVTTNWAANLYFAESLAAGGAILGLALGASRLRRNQASWLALAYTVVVVPWQLSSASMEKLLLDRLEDVGGVLLVSLGQFVQRQPVKDPLFFVAFAGLVFWLLAIVAGFSAARNRNILAGIIPAGTIMLVIQVYANYQLRGSWWLGVYLLLALILIGRSYYLQSRTVWTDRRVYVHEDAWANILGGLFTIAAVTIVIAWLMPASVSSVRAATDAWTDLTRGLRDRLSNAVTALNGPYGRPGVNFYGTSLALGQDAAAGDAPVFNVEVLKPPDSNLRYYWRGRVYDTYQNGGWTISSGSVRDFDPAAGNLRVADTDNRSDAQLRFTLLFPSQSLIYAPSQPLWLDRQANVEVTPVEAGLDDVLYWQAKNVIPTGNHYEVRSAIGNPGVPELRSALASYPRWVQDRYLQVPDGLRPKFQALAEKVIAGQESQYDKTVAITNYLRGTLQYSTSLPAVPEGQDPVEWVLFDYKKGFCNYYASAEVLMLRSVGIPARLAVGFAQGEYQNGTYIVRRRDAHAWPEVFFPALGWVEFEPTVSQQPLARVDPSVAANAGPGQRPVRDPREEDGGVASEPSTTPRTVRPIPMSPATGRALTYAYSLFAAGWALYLLYRTRALRFVTPVLARVYESSGLTTPAWLDQWFAWNRLHPVEQAFASVNWSLRWLGRPAPLGATPSERAAALRRLLPSAAEHITSVAAELERGLFTPEPADVPRARRAGLMVLLHAARARVGRM